MPNPKRNITADQFYTQNRNKRMPVELRVGVTMVGSKAIDFNGNDALAQPESPQTLVAENAKTNAESDMHFQYNSQPLSNENVEDSNVFCSSNQQTLRNYFVRQGNQFVTKKASDVL